MIDLVDNGRPYFCELKQSDEDKLKIIKFLHKHFRGVQHKMYSNSEFEDTKYYGEDNSKYFNMLVDYRGYRNVLIMPKIGFRVNIGIFDAVETYKYINIFFNKLSFDVDGDKVTMTATPKEVNTPLVYFLVEKTQRDRIREKYEIIKKSYPNVELNDLDKRIMYGTNLIYVDDKNKLSNTQHPFFTEYFDFLTEVK